jgi:hypothetical protein
VQGYDGKAFNRDSKKDTHLEAENARLSHIRPQDRNKPDFSELAAGEHVIYNSHSGRESGIVDRDLGAASEQFAHNLNTREGRGDKGDEHLYAVIEERSGDERILKRSDIKGESDHPHSTIDPSLHDSMSAEPKGPRRK